MVLMFRYAFGRFYFALIGVLLLTVPLFALVRADPGHLEPPCPINALCTPGPGLSPLEAGHWWSLFWTAGRMPGDYWPIALLLLGAGVVMHLVMTSRSRSR